MLILSGLGDPPYRIAEAGPCRDLAGRAHEPYRARRNAGLPRRYADYDEASFGISLGHKDFGWTAFESLSDHPPSGLSDPYLIANVISTVAVVSLGGSVGCRSG